MLFLCGPIQLKLLSLKRTEIMMFLLALLDALSELLPVEVVVVVGVVVVVKVPEEVVEVSISRVSSQ